MKFCDIRKISPTFLDKSLAAFVSGIHDKKKATTFAAFPVSPTACLTCANEIYSVVCVMVDCNSIPFPCSLSYTVSPVMEE